MKTILLLLIIIFAAYENVSAAPAQAVVKLVKNISKTTKKVPARKPLKRIPAKTGSSMNGKRPASSMVMVDRGEIFSKGKMATK